MINRIINKVNFLYLRFGISSFRHFRKIKPFDQLHSQLLEQHQEMLRPYYEQYVKEVSRADMAASLELAAFMYTVCKLNHYTKLLDMGSGLSSFVFRLYAREHAGVKVFSVDDDAAWLEKTKAYLSQHQLSVDNIFTLDQFLKSKEAEFDCVLHDLNFVEVRSNYIDYVLQITRKNGLMIFDDVHKPDYLMVVLRKLQNTPTEKFDLKPVTYDQYGRFSLAVIKNG